jgi:hypothetical protein
MRKIMPGFGGFAITMPFKGTEYYNKALTEGYILNLKEKI